jgi:ferredoxin-type protein NapH
MTGHQIKHIFVQIVRRCVQLAVVALIAGLVFLSLYAHYWAAKALEDVQAMTGVTGAVLGEIDRWVSPMARPDEFLNGFKGTLWSMRLAGFDISDPLAAAELVAASKTIHWPMLLSIVIPVVFTLLAGRAFCSWMCPGYLLFEIGGKLRKLLRLAELPPADVRFSRYNKYIFLGVGLVAAAVTSRPLFALIYPPAVVSRLLHAWIFGTALTGMLILLGAILAFEVLVSHRWFCRTLCPGGALLGLIGAVRVLRVRFKPSLCTGCGKCEPVCEEGIDPVVESDGLECDNCGKCVRHCPARALVWAIGPPKRARAKAIAPAHGSLIAVLFWAALAAAVLAPPAALAHHILGLPHYSYKENYPQVPTLEYPAVTGPYDVLLTSYPGRPVPSEPANVAFYIKNSTSGEPYAKPVTVRVLQTFTFGRNRELQPPIRLQPFDQLHKLAVTFDREGEYIVELTMDVEGQPEVIPFLMVVGEPSSAWSVLISVGAGLALFVVVVRAIKIKRDRHLASLEQPVIG